MENVAFGEAWGLFFNQFKPWCGADSQVWIKQVPAHLTVTNLRPSGKQTVQSACVEWE